MRTSKHLLIGLMSVTCLVGAVGLVVAPSSQADALKGGFQFKKILKKIFPPCGPGTRDQRFKVSKDGNSVCDNNTGLWWQQSPSMGFFICEDAIQHCEDLTLSRRTWRLPEVEEIQWNSLIDYSEPNQATALNTPNGPFQNVQSSNYWSATELAGDSTSAWSVGFGGGDVGSGNKVCNGHAWCVSGGEDAHGH